MAGRFLPAYLVLLGAAPYLVCCLGGIPFQWAALGKIAAIALALGYWHSVFRPSPASDLGFLALVAFILISNMFQQIYPRPYPGVDVNILGRLTTFLSAVLALMLVRRVQETGYGLWPSRNDWKQGLIHFGYFLPIGLPAGLLMGAMKFRDAPAPLWAIVGTFFAFLWVVSLFEEFLLRGVLQNWFENWTGSATAALLCTSAVFGLIHLPYAGRFPNWRWVLLAGVLGVFCGRARNQAGSIKASVVTHALVVTVYRGFFH
jgi:uncharacterized protein